MAFREHLGEFAGKAGHLLFEGFVVLCGFFDAYVAAGGEDVVLLGDVFGIDDGAESFFVFKFAFLEFLEGGGEFLDVLFAEVAVLAVHHVAHVACVNEERLAFLLFASAYKPERDGDGDAVEELGGHGDYAFDEVRFDDAFADFAFAAGLGAECAVRKDEPDFSAGCEVVNHVFDPREVRVACGREAVLPARVFLQLFLAPVLEVEGRVRHDKVEAFVGVQVVEERVFVVLAEVRVDAADGHVHFRHFPGVGVGLLSVNAYVVAVATVVLDKLDALHEHAAGTAAGVIDALAFARFEDAHDGFHDACGGVEFASLHAFVACELRNAVFVGAAEQILARFGVAHVHVAEHIDHIAEYTLIEVGGRVVLGEHAFERLVVLLDFDHRLVENLADFGSMGGFRDFGPPGVLRYKEDVFAHVFVEVFFEAFAFGDEFVVAFFECGRNVTQEDEPCENFAVVRRRDVPPEFAGGVPDLLFKAESCRGCLCRFSCTCHSINPLLQRQYNYKIWTRSICPLQKLLHKQNRDFCSRFS